MAAELKLRGTAIHYGVADVRIEGTAKVERIHWRARRPYAQLGL